MRCVDLQDLDRRSTDGRAAHEQGSVPAEVSLPLVPSRMEEPSSASRLRVDPGEVRSFVMVVGKTSQGEIAKVRRASVLFRHHVIDLMRNRREGFRQLAILTAVPRSLTNFPR